MTSRTSGPRSDREAYARLCAKFPTAALAVTEFEVDEWRGLGETGRRPSAFVTPKHLIPPCRDKAP